MLTKRLKMILSHVKGNVCADIGTDHAYIPIKLAEQGVSVIATDISDGPLENARKNAEKCERDVRARIDLRRGAGLKPLRPGEVDTIIVAGMGGELIWKIISEDWEISKKSLLLLQPMNSQAELRENLIGSGFEIINEDIEIEGHKIYNLLEVRFVGTKLRMPDEIDLHLPPVLYNHENFERLLEKKEREFKKIHAGLVSAAKGDQNEIEHYAVLKKKAQGIREELKRGTQKWN